MRTPSSFRSRETLWSASSRSITLLAPSSFNVKRACTRNRCWTGVQSRGSTCGVRVRAKKGKKGNDCYMIPQKLDHVGGGHLMGESESKKRNGKKKKANDCYTILQELDHVYVDLVHTQTNKKNVMFGVPETGLLKCTLRRPEQEGGKERKTARDIRRRVDI